MSNILRLKIVDKNNFEKIHDNVEKQKSKRGRPRKNISQTQQIIPTEPTEITSKKKGRKRKIDNIIDISKKENDDIGVSTSITKSFIVQLKIKSIDLEQIQTQFINKSQKIGYDNKVNIDDNEDFNDYYSLLNKLELPLIPVPFQISEKILPNIQNLYQKIIIPILPENVPIQLFDSQQIGGSTLTNQKSISDEIRNTNDLLLPLLDNNGQWPQKSSYACWNCDIYFSGTPIGVPDKEVDGRFYCYGNFCSFECAARYLSERENNIDFWNKYSLLCLIYQRAYNLPPETKVPIAPPKESLNKYGGKLSYESYHNINKNDIFVEIYKLPLIPVLLHIGEMYRSTNINNIIQHNNQIQKPTNKNCKVVKFIPIDPTKISKAEANIKQKTHILLQSNYTLDKCLHKNKICSGNKSKYVESKF